LLRGGPIVGGASCGGRRVGVSLLEGCGRGSGVGCWRGGVAGAKEKNIFSVVEGALLGGGVGVVGKKILRGGGGGRVGW